MFVLILQGDDDDDDGDDDDCSQGPVEASEKEIWLHFAEVHR